MRVLLALALLLGLTPFAIAAAAEVDSKFLSLEEALELAFPKCEVERENVFLTKEQRAKAEKLAGGQIESRLLLRYTATRKKEGEEPKIAGWAYVDTHKVRAKRETLLIVVNPDDSIRRLEVLAFAEPREYLPRANWYAQFLGKKLNKDLRIKRDIKNVSGATLTAEATTSAVRKVLSVHQITLRPDSDQEEKTDK